LIWKSIKKRYQNFIHYQTTTGIDEFEGLENKICPLFPFFVLMVWEKLARLKNFLYEKNLIHSVMQRFPDCVQSKFSSAGFA
jgi:hypothetical protein